MKTFFFLLSILSLSAQAQSTYSSMNQDSNPTVKDFDKYKDNSNGYVKQAQEFNEKGNEVHPSFDSDAYKKDQDYIQSKKNSFNDL